MNQPNRKLIISLTSSPLIKKLFQQNVSDLFHGAQNRFSKQEKGSSKQKMEFFSNFQASDKKILLEMCLICFKVFKIDFLNWKSNYPNWKWNLFSYFKVYDQKHLLQNISLFFQGVKNWFTKYETELSKQEIESFFLDPGLW